MPALHPDLAILDVGGPEILIIMLIALLLFGSDRLPDLARSMGRSIREFKKATSSIEEELRRAIEAPPPPPRAPGKTPASPVPPGPAAAQEKPAPPPPLPPEDPPPPPGDFRYP